LFAALDGAANRARFDLRSVSGICDEFTAKTKQ
jgi:hypothetical protein